MGFEPETILGLGRTFETYCIVLWFLTPISVFSDLVFRKYQFGDIIAIIIAPLIPLFMHIKEGLPDGTRPSYTKMEKFKAWMTLLVFTSWFATWVISRVYYGGG